MSSTMIVRAGLCALGLFVCAGAPVALALEPEKQPAAAGDAKPAEDAKAKAILEAMSKFYSGAKAMSGEVKMAMSMGGQDNNSTVKFAIARPNRISVVSAGTGEEADGPMAPGSLVSDGKTLWVTGGMLDMFKKYIKKDAPETLGDLAQDMDVMMGMGMNPGAMMPIMLSSEDGLNQLTEETGSLTLAGTEKVGDVECHKLTFKPGEGEEEDGQGAFYIQTGDTPWLRKIAFEADAPMGSVKMTVDFANLSSAEPSEGAFAFKAPEGYEAVASMRDAMPDLVGDDMGGGGHDAPHASIGKAAPALKLPYITGGTGEIDIASHKGKQVVLLDFWATWCPPCVKGLPTVSKVAADFKDKGVAFYAVNVGEEPDEVIEFMKKKKWDFTAISDKSNATSDAYGISGIPHTVIIGKDGVVRQVHVGLIPNLEKQLAKELEAVLAGKDPREGDKKVEAGKDERKDDSDKDDDDDKDGMDDKDDDDK